MEGAGPINYSALPFVADELHEAVVHVELHVAVEEGVAGVVGGEVHGDGLERHDVDDVLLEAAEVLSPMAVTSKLWRWRCMGCWSPVAFWKMRRYRLPF